MSADPTSGEAPKNDLPSKGKRDPSPPWFGAAWGWVLRAGAEWPEGCWRAASMVALPMWLVLSLYFGILGWAAMDIDAVVARSAEASGSAQAGTPSEYQLAGTPMTFRSLQDLSDYTRETTLQDFGTTVGSPGAFYLGMPRSAAILLATFAFGVLGGTTRQVRDLALLDRPFQTVRPFSFPLFGGLMGMVLFIITFIAPSIVMSADGSPPRATAVLALSLIGGLFADKVILLVEELVQRVIQITPTSTAATQVEPPPSAATDEPEVLPTGLTEGE